MSERREVVTVDLEQVLVIGGACDGMWVDMPRTDDVRYVREPAKLTRAFTDLNDGAHTTTAHPYRRFRTMTKGRIFSVLGPHDWTDSQVFERLVTGYRPGTE